MNTPCVTGTPSVALATPVPSEPLATVLCVAEPNASESSALGQGACGTASTRGFDSVLSHMDARLLDMIQTDFPLESRPYAVLGVRLGLTEAETLARVRALKDKKIIRRLGANFQSAALGFRSTLCAAKVPDTQLDAFIKAVNSRPGVTHNYIRRHAYNVWFTLIGSSWDMVCATLDALSAETGINILNLPAARLYKIRVDFRMVEADA